MSRAIPLLLLLILVCSPLYSVEAAAGRFLWPATTGNFTPVTGLPFQPRVVLFTGSVGNVDETGGGHVVLGVGISSSSMMVVKTVLGDGTLRTAGTHRNNRCWITLSSTGGVLTAGSLVSMNSDGFTLNANTASSSYPNRVYWLALGGSDLTNYSLVSYQAPTSTGQQTLTGAGFTPTAAIFITAGMTAAINNTVTNVDLFPGFGLASGSAQYGVGQAYTYSTNSETRAQSSQMVYLPGASSMWWAASFVEFTSDGMTLNWSTVQSTGIYFWVLYLRGPRMTPIAFNTPTATGNFDHTGLTDYTPKGVLLFSFCRSAATGPQSAASLTTGYLASDSAMHFWGGGDAGTNSSGNANSLTRLDCREMVGTSRTVRTRAEFLSWLSTGFRLNYLTAYTNPIQFIGMAFGDAFGKKRVVIQ